MTPKSPMSPYVEEKKFSQLKSMNVPWITIQTSSYKSASSSPSKKNSPRQSNSAPTTPERVFQPFQASKVTFSREEMKMLDPEPEFQEKLRIYRSNSKLLQLQDQNQEREKEMALISPKKQVEPPPKKQIEKSDSFISANFDEEDNFIRQISSEMLVQPQKPRNFELTDDQSIKDLRKSVWRHCHGMINTYDAKKIHAVNGNLNHATIGNSVDLHLTKGQKKVRRAIEDHSSLEDPMKGLSHDDVLTNDQKAEERELMSSMKDTYSGKRLRNYIEENGERPPRFLEDMEFTKNAIVSRPKHKVSSRFKPAKRPKQQIDSNHGTFQ